MKLYGIDFTSRPRRRKPITCLECTLTDDRLQAGELTTWEDFAGFEAALRRPGPWIAGIDFPFGQARRFIETISWPRYKRSSRQKDHASGTANYQERIVRNALNKGTRRADDSEMIGGNCCL